MAPFYTYVWPCNKNREFLQTDGVLQIFEESLETWGYY